MFLSIIGTREDRRTFRTEFLKVTLNEGGKFLFLSSLVLSNILST